MATKVVDLGSVIGPQGPKGDTGPQGPKGDTGAKGATGAKGDKGDPGAAGQSAYQQAVAAGYTGTEAAFYAALVSMKDAPFLPLSGGAVSGLLTVLGTIWLDATGDAYIRSSEGELILSAGSVDVLKIYDGEVTFPYGGTIEGVNAPFNPTDATNKAYVDAETAKCLPLAGGAMTGLLEIAGRPNGYPAVYLGKVRPNDDFAPYGIGNLPDGGFLGAQITFTDDCFTKFFGACAEFDCSVSLMNGGTCSTILNAPGAIVNKDYVDKKTLIFTGKTVAVSAWAANSTYSAQGYAYRASVACTGVTASHRPDVAFGAADAVGGNFAPFSESYAGGVYIYCKTKPTATITIPSIVCVKGA